LPQACNDGMVNRDWEKECHNNGTVQTLPAQGPIVEWNHNHDGVISLFNHHHTTRYMFVPMSHRERLGHLAKPIPLHPGMQLHFFISLHTPPRSSQGESRYKRRVRESFLAARLHWHDPDRIHTSWAAFALSCRLNIISSQLHKSFVDCHKAQFSELHS